MNIIVRISGISSIIIISSARISSINIIRSISRTIIISSVVLLLLVLQCISSNSMGVNM